MKQSYRFSQDYLSETWPLLAFASGPGREPRRAGRDPPAGSADPIGRGPRLSTLGPDPAIRAPDFVQQRTPPDPKRQKKFGKNGGFPPIRDFLLKIRSRFGDRVPRFFGDFWQKPQKRAKKTALSSSSSVLDGFEDGKRAEDRGPAARFRCAARRHSRIEGRVPPAADAISPHKRPSLVDLVPGCRVLVRRARRDLPLFRAPVGFERESRAGARHDSLTKGQKKTRPDCSGRARCASAAERLPVALVGVWVHGQHLVEHQNRQGISGGHGHGLAPAFLAIIGDHIAIHDAARLTDKKLGHYLAPYISTEIDAPDKTSFTISSTAACRSDSLSGSPTRSSRRSSIMYSISLWCS